MNYKLLIMKSDFLDKFKGKTQTIGKEGVNNVLGGSNQGVTVYSNSKGISKPSIKKKSSLR